MRKRCTNSSCRKVFTLSSTNSSCPFCGKYYSGVTISSSETNNKLSGDKPHSLISAPASNNSCGLRTYKDDYLYIRKSTAADKKHPVRTIFVDDYSVTFSKKVFSTRNNSLNRLCSIIYSSLTKFGVSEYTTKSLMIRLFFAIISNKDIYLDYTTSSFSGTLDISRVIEGSTIPVSRWLDVDFSK